MQASENKMNQPAAPPFSGAWQWMRNALSGVRIGKTPRRLRLCESLSLGEKRFVAVIEFETERFLVGGGAASVNLLARLGEGPDFAALLSEWSERQR